MKLFRPSGFFRSLTFPLRFTVMLTVIVYNTIDGMAEQRTDSILRQLDEVVVTARRPNDDIIPAQTLSGDELHRLNSNSVADALRYFSGVQVKDYGGVGGIKTVNIRSMGTNHTGVVYDGVELGNAQNG